ncbi:MAG: DUF805 domain-containing protein [SAR202 cluster bacterium]|nr:hypothetical protein [Chloroflexota bacterium]MQG51271.1 DUF805 domain-containing protein [SAR202 cluster bacterium]|tara:strand:- start:10035 stop:10442 length:408 start_codon:yes stop_codon:yes gene_type:complete
MSFVDAIKSVLIVNYFNFSGRARRSEYNYFLLFNILINIGFTILAYLLGTNTDDIISALTSLAWLAGIQLIVSLLLFIPGISVGVRRLHDINKSGWWVLIMIPLSLLVIPVFIYLYWLIIKEGDSSSNNYGEPVK